MQADSLSTDVSVFSNISTMKAVAFTGLDGARLTPGGLQAVLRFLAGQSLPTSQQAQGSVSSWRAWRPGEDSGQELGHSEQPSVPQLVFTVTGPKLSGTPGATSCLSKVGHSLLSEQSQ